MTPPETPPPDPAPAPAPAPEPAPPPPDPAQVEAAARAEAQRQAAVQGVTLTDAQLDQIGKTAAAETMRLFEQAGAFHAPEPPPPAPPPEPAPEPGSDTAPTKDSFAKRFLGA